MGPHLVFTDAILGHSLCDFGQGTGNKVIYAQVCSYSMSMFTVVLCNNHCELVLTVFHNGRLINYEHDKYKSKQFYMHA